jgi:periplasmic divalent cation tolerance protein
MTDFIQVITTVERQEDAEKIARSLVEGCLAACVQVLGPVTSTYHWQGSIQSSREWICLIKTRADLCTQIEEAIRKIHPYEVPEILAVPILAGSKSYLEWMEKEVRGKGDGGGAKDQG